MHTTRISIVKISAETVKDYSNPGRGAETGAIIDFSPSQLGSYRMQHIGQGL